MGRSIQSTAHSKKPKSKKNKAMKAKVNTQNNKHIFWNEIDGKYFRHGNIDEIKVGDILPNCFGQMRKITEIISRDIDSNGRKYCFVKQEFNTNSTITHTFYEA